MQIYVRWLLELHQHLQLLQRHQLVSNLTCRENLINFQSSKLLFKFSQFSEWRCLFSEPPRPTPPTPPTPPSPPPRPFEFKFVPFNCTVVQFSSLQRGNDIYLCFEQVWSSWQNDPDSRSNPQFGFQLSPSVSLNDRINKDKHATTSKIEGGCLNWTLPF